MNERCPRCGLIKNEGQCCRKEGKIIKSSLARVPSPDGRVDFSGSPLTILPPGTILKEKYSLKYLTAGGMGAIYLAENRETSEKFVIKEAYSIDIKKKEDFIRALEKEREILSALKHPGIVKFIDFFSEKDSSCLVLEYIEGKSLEKYQKEIPAEEIEEDMALDMAIQLCEIIIYLHNRKPPLIYRDLKPSNIMVTQEGNVKLIDFGISSIAGEIRTDFATHGFSAPEQYGTGKIDVRSDIYSIGATLHYLLTSKDPRSKEDMFHFPPVREFNPTVSEELEKVVSKATQLDQGKRFSSVEEMMAELKALQSSISVKPNFFNLGQIEYGKKEIFTLKIINKGKGKLKGRIHVPESIALKGDREIFSGETTVTFELNTSKLNINENYSDNIVIFSSGGEAYIPLSFKVMEKMPERGEKENVIQEIDKDKLKTNIVDIMPAIMERKKTFYNETDKDKLKTNIIDIMPAIMERKKIIHEIDKNKWKTKIVDIAPSPPVCKEKKATITSQKKKKHFFLLSLIIIASILLVLVSSTVIKIINYAGEENLLREKNLTYLRGCKICFTDDREQYDIFSVNPDGTDLKNLTENTSRSSFPSWSPVEDKIAFSTGTGGHYNIFIMNGDGSNPVRVTEDKLEALCPSWSPDGEKIAFQCFYEENNEIFTIKSDGTRLLNITRHKGEDFSPSWSPDGKYIAFESKRDEIKDNIGGTTREIYIMRTDGSNPVRITENNYDDFSPAWSPDSSRLVFISNVNNNYDIYTIKADGSNLQRVTANDRGKKNYPSWTRDGEKIIYGYYRKEGWKKIPGVKKMWEIHIINSDGKEDCKLLDFGGYEADIKFPPKN